MYAQEDRQEDEEKSWLNLKAEIDEVLAESAKDVKNRKDLIKACEGIIKLQDEMIASRDAEIKRLKEARGY